MREAVAGPKAAARLPFVFTPERSTCPMPRMVWTRCFSSATRAFQSAGAIASQTSCEGMTDRSSMSGLPGPARIAAASASVLPA